MRKITAMIAISIAATTLPAMAQAKCSAMSVRLTPAVRAADAAQVSRTAQGAHTPAASVAYVLREPGWRVVWATPRNSEPGVFFFRVSGSRYRFVDVWGGVVDDRKFAMDWARDLKGGGPSAALRNCFADAMVEGKWR